MVVEQKRTAIEEVQQQVLQILAEVLQQTDLQLETPLTLSSIQTLKALSHVERRFAIEIEDEYVFKGLFSSGHTLSTYILQNFHE